MQSDLLQAYPKTKIGEVEETPPDIKVEIENPASPPSHGHSHGGRPCHGHGHGGHGGHGHAHMPIKFPIYRSSLFFKFIDLFRFHLPCGECEWDTEVTANILRRNPLVTWAVILSCCGGCYWWLFL